MLARIYLATPVHRYVRPAACSWAALQWRGCSKDSIRESEQQPPQIHESEVDYTSDATKLDHYASPSPDLPAQSGVSRPSLQSLLPPSPSSHHTSQATFLRHSRRVGLNPASTVFTGTRYEYLVLSSLRRLGIELARVGGSGDKGVDLIGWWHLPQWKSKTSTTEVADLLKVMVQCKRIASTTKRTKAVGPNVVRELEGAFRGAPGAWRNANDVVGLLVGTRAATKGVLDSMRRSERALGWVLLEEVDDTEATTEAEVAEDDVNAGQCGQSGKVAQGEDGQDVGPVQKYTLLSGRIKQILWNQKARELGLEGLDVVKKYSADSNSDEVALVWKGKPVQALSGIEE